MLYIYKYLYYIYKSRDRLIIVAKVFLKLSNFHMIFSKGKSAIPPLFNGPEVLSSACDKAKLIPKNFFKNSNPDNSGISLPIFPFRADLKLHNISVTPKLVKKVKANLDSSKASCPDFILVLALKNCEPQLSNILAEELKITAMLVFFLCLVKSLKNF